jgi:ABC-2 type transport system permease protein
MSATIYLQELRVRFRSVIVWSVAVAALLFVFTSMFPGFSAQAAAVREMFARFPPVLLDAFGMQSTDLSALLGFYGFLFVFVQLCLAIQAGNYGFGLVSIEETELTADFLLTRPVSRVQVMTSKLLAALSSLTITNAVVWVASFSCLAAFSGGQPWDAGTVALVLATIVLFQLFFLAVGLILSLLVKRVRSVTPFSLALGFGMYILNAFGSVLAQAKLEYLTPFKHLDPGFIVRTLRLDTPLVLANAAVSVIAIGLSYWLYVRRDIPSVS